MWQALNKILKLSLIILSVVFIIMNPNYKSLWVKCFSALFGATPSYQLPQFTTDTVIDMQFWILNPSWLKVAIKQKKPTRTMKNSKHALFPDKSNA